MIVLIGVSALGFTINNTMQISNSAKEIAEKTSDANRLRELEKTLAEVKLVERDFLLTGDRAFLERREEL